MKCGHDPSNIRERWTRTRKYPIRECMICVKARKDKDYNRRYMYEIRHGLRQPKQKKLTTEERNWRQMLWRSAKRVQVEKREYLQSDTYTLYNEAVAAVTDPELLKLIEEQQKDDRTFYVNRKFFISYNEGRGYTKSVRRRTTELGL